jgi:hypothetical protein
LRVSNNERMRALRLPIARNGSARHFRGAIAAFGEPPAARPGAGPAVLEPGRRLEQPSYQTVRLMPGRHPSPRFGACVVELASMLAEEPFSDRPASVSRVIGSLLRTYNDGLDDERRQDLYELAATVVGTAAGRSVENERASRCLEFARALGAPLPAGRAAIGTASAEASGALAALAALRTGPTDDVHARTLALVRELASARSRPRIGSARLIRRAQRLLPC